MSKPKTLLVDTSIRTSLCTYRSVTTRQAILTQSEPLVIKLKRQLLQASTGVLTVLADTAAAYVPMCPATLHFPQAPAP